MQACCFAQRVACVVSLEPERFYSRLLSVASKIAEEGDLIRCHCVLLQTGGSARNWVWYITILILTFAWPAERLALSVALLSLDALAPAVLRSRRPERRRLCGLEHLDFVSLSAGQRQRRTPSGGAQSVSKSKCDESDVVCVLR